MLQKKAAILTLGCRLNSADSALLTGRLGQIGFTIQESPEDADLIVVNSCAVTAEAVKKSRRLLRKLRKDHPCAKIIATGCAVELEHTALADDAVDLYLNNAGKADFADAVTNLFKDGRTWEIIEPEAASPFRENAESLFPFKSRAFIKIQEGCNNFCSYCIVPYVRGRERSRDFNEVLADCRQALLAGFPEIVLTGVNVCAYRDNGRTLTTLLDALDSLDGTFRIRLSSTEPHPDNRTLLDAMARSKRVCRFLHLSLQHGSDRILKEMNRHYTSADYAEFAAEARQLIPDLHLGSDVIVGFPGETEADFMNSCDFIRSMQFANLHLFSYSPRPGTPAAEMPGRVPAEEVKRRYEYLRTIADESALAFKRSQLGKTLGVIFEETVPGNFVKGWSDNYLQIKIPADGVVLDRIVNVTANPKNLELEHD